MDIRTVTAALTLCILPLACSDASSEAPGPTEHRELLFDLTQTEIEETLAHYDAFPMASVAVDALTAPFDCTHFDDLCELVGQAEAEALTATVWDMARERVPLEDIQAVTDEALRNADVELVVDAEEEWEAEAEVPELVDPDATVLRNHTCNESSVSRQTVNGRRLKVEAKVSAFILYWTVRAKSFSYEEDFSGSFVADKANRLEIAGDFDRTYVNSGGGTSAQNAWSCADTNTNAKTTTCSRNVTAPSGLLPAGDAIVFRSRACGELDHNSISLATCACETRTY